MRKIQAPRLLLLSKYGFYMEGLGSHVHPKFGHHMKPTQVEKHQVDGHGELMVITIHWTVKTQNQEPRSLKLPYPFPLGFTEEAARQVARNFDRSLAGYPIGYTLLTGTVGLLESITNITENAVGFITDPALAGAVDLLQDLKDMHEDMTEDKSEKGEHSGSARKEAENTVANTEPGKGLDTLLAIAGVVSSVV